jgi:hypothetical protein
MLEYMYVDCSAMGAFIRDALGGTCKHSQHRPTFRQNKTHEPIKPDCVASVRPWSTCISLGRSAPSALVFAAASCSSSGRTPRVSSSTTPWSLCAYPLDTVLNGSVAPPGVSYDETRGPPRAASEVRRGEACMCRASGRARRVWAVRESMLVVVVVVVIVVVVKVKWRLRPSGHLGREQVTSWLL